MGYALSINLNAKFVTMQCGDCGVLFAVPPHLHSEWERTGKSWYCPNGHCRAYAETTAERLRKELATMTTDRDWQKSRAESLAKQVTAQKAVTTRLTKRVAAGVCPHCHRTVKQLAAHMVSKHPEAVRAGRAPTTP